MSGLELRVPPPAVAAVVAAAMYGVAALLPQLTLAVPYGAALSLLLAALGLALALAGVVALRRQRTTVSPLDPAATSAIVTDGVYRWSRNPMYLGLLAVLAAWALYLSNAASPLLLAGFVGYLNRFQITPEERALLAKFGTPYAQYLRRVRRWL